MGGILDAMRLRLRQRRTVTGSEQFLRPGNCVVDARLEGKSRPKSFLTTLGLERSHVLEFRLAFVACTPVVI